MGTYCVPLEPILIAKRDNGVGSCLFVPIYPGIPSIPTGHFENRDWRYPHGSHIQTIQERNDKDIASEVVKIIKNDADVRSKVKPFSFQALSCLPPFPWSLSSRDLTNPIRQDFRHLGIFSVDPPGCKNIDDALHCRALPNGNFEVGVHIADVTNFVQPGTVIDNEIAKRATSLSFERRIDILPKILSEEICSLRAGMEKLAFSVIWEMTPEAEIISTTYTKSVIKNCAALCYTEAQARMDDSGLVDAVSTNLRNLSNLAKIMRQNRIDGGALITLTSGSHDAFDEGWEAKQMVEELMLAANVSVAEKILKHLPMCSLLRRQTSPTKERLEPLLRIANGVGVNLDVTSSKAMSESLNCAVTVHPSTNDLIRTMAMRCMNPAVYFCSGDVNPSEYSHYSLAVPVYTHFTSPNRRYADIIVHRLLEASLGIISVADILQKQHQITTLANSLNQRHWNAQLAKHASMC